MSIQTESSKNPTGMPEGEELQQQVQKRHQRGKIWLSLFQIALISAIIALVVLIANIVILHTRSERLWGPLQSLAPHACRV